MKRLLLVCLGNICRSPVAEAVVRTEFERARVPVFVTSAGTGAWHIGHPADPRAQRSAAARGYDLSAHRARRVEVADFANSDWLLAMDRENLAELQASCPQQYLPRLELFLPFCGVDAPLEVPDPYYRGQRDFDHVVDLARAGALGLIDKLSGLG